MVAKAHPLAQVFKNVVDGPQAAVLGLKLPPNEVLLGRLERLKGVREHPADVLQVGQRPPIEAAHSQKAVWSLQLLLLQKRRG